MTTIETNLPQTLQANITELELHRDRLKAASTECECNPSAFSETELAGQLGQSWKRFREIHGDLDLRGMNQPLETRRRIAEVAIEALGRIPANRETLKELVSHLLSRIPALAQALIDHQHLFKP